MPRIAIPLLTAALTAIAAGAHAHAFLQSSDPLVGATIPHPPAAVTITYTEGVEPDFSALTVQDGAGRDMAAGPVHTAANDQTTLILPLKPLPPGTYHVRWHVVSVDTHKTQGDFRFTVSP